MDDDSVQVDRLTLVDMTGGVNHRSNALFDENFKLRPLVINQLISIALT
jgi:hypothetical protein